MSIEQCNTIQTSCEFSLKIKLNPYIEQKKIYIEKQETILDQNQVHVPDVVSQNIDETSAQQFISTDYILLIFLIVAILIYYFIRKFRREKQQNKKAEIELDAIQKRKAQSGNPSQEEQIQFIETSCQESDGTQNRFTAKWGEKKSKQKNIIQPFKLSDNKIQYEDSQIQLIQDVQQSVVSLSNYSNEEKHSDVIQHEDKMQLDGQQPQIDKPPQHQFDNAKTLKEQYQFDLQQKQSNVEKIKLDENNQFKQQNHKDEQQNIMQQELQENKVDIDIEKEEQKQIVENQQNLIRAYEIINEQLYIPSFKSRQIDDVELKKFVKSFKDVKQFKEEYNLDGSQELLFLSEIQVFIPIRGDGNCLFTSIGFQYIFYNLIDDQRFERLVGLIQKTEFQQIYKQNIQQNGHQMEIPVFQIETDAEKKILRLQFENFILKMKKSFHNQNEYNQLYLLADSINDYNGPFYGLLIIFMRNYFRQILQEFYDTNEMKFLIQNPELIQEINTWEHMYDETDIALNLFAQQEQILIKCFQKMNIDDKAVNISEYKADNQQQFQYKIGLSFQPGHYNVLILKN